MRYKLLVFLSLLITSCVKEDILEDVCITGECQAEWVIDTTLQENAYKDDMNYWHVEASKGYFTIKGELDEIYEDYKVNDVPLVETSFDSNKWIWIEGWVFEIPLYNPFREYFDPQFTRPLTIGEMVLKVCNMIQGGEVYNLAGYTFNDKWCGDCPYSGRVMGTYSSNTLSPQQNIYVDNRVKGDTIEFYMKTKFNYDLGNSEEVYKSLRVIVE